LGYRCFVRRGRRCPASPARPTALPASTWDRSPVDSREARAVGKRRSREILLSAREPRAWLRHPDKRIFFTQALKIARNPLTGWQRGDIVCGTSERKPKINTAVLGAAFVATTAGLAAIPPSAVASGTLYCNKVVPHSKGCGHFWPPEHTIPNDTNSARNESDGTICIAASYIGGAGHSHCAINGAVVTSHLRSPKRSEYSSPLGYCWNGGADPALIHCRYSSSVPD
jgi:hypothetical protein